MTGSVFNSDAKNFQIYENQIMSLLDAADVSLANQLPSEWAEKNRMMTSDVSPIPGLFSYENTPYAKPIVDCLAPSHPARIIALKAGSQIGKSTGIIENGIGWIIAQQPGNILFLVGHDGLVKDSMKKVDTMIDSSGIRHLIKSSSKRIRNTKSGDTDAMKEFPGGYMKLGIANHGYLRNISMRYGFIDDFERMKSFDKSSGSTSDMIEQRFAAYYKKMKLMYISTPEIAETSNIEAAYLKGDQRKWHIPAPCCGELIAFEWEVKSETSPGGMGGITWRLDDNDRLIAESVGYTCQSCGGFFDDRDKMELMRAGQYIATATPSEPGYLSFHISALYAPTFMYNWEHYVRKYLEANPPNGKRIEEKWKTFRNLVLGETYEPSGQSLSANAIQNNVRLYDIGTIPEKQSIIDGNGRIVMLTCGSDLNGLEDDGRLDFEIVAHSETGATYSVDHGSIGTFIPRDKHPENRPHFTYRHGASNSIWPLFEAVITKKYVRDSDEKSMRIFITGVDTGYQTNYAYQFVDGSNLNVVSLKGKDDDRFIRDGADVKTYKRAQEKNNLYLVESNHTKDILSENMNLKWDPNLNDVQPFGFMNFPTPDDGKYLFKNYFSHFEAEHKVIDKKGYFRWVKKSKNHQNHIFDCRLYAMVVRDIFKDKLLKEMGKINPTWQDYVNVITKKRSQ